MNQDLEKGITPAERHSDSNDESAITASNTYARQDDNYIYIKNQRINKDDFLTAFGGHLNVSPRKETTQAKDFGDPVPAGLAAFSCTVISLGLVQMHARGITHANVLLGAMLTTSGLVELIVGVLCFIIGNGWACCTFLMFGGFWSSYACILMDMGSILSNYSDMHEYEQGIALYFLPWAIFSFGLFACTWKSTWPLFSLMFCVWFFVLLFTIAQFIGSVKLFKAGGFFCLLSGVVGFYNMFAGLADDTNSYMVIKPWFMPHAVRPPKKD